MSKAKPKLVTVEIDNYEVTGDPEALRDQYEAELVEDGVNLKDDEAVIRACYNGNPQMSDLEVCAPWEE